MTIYQFLQHLESQSLLQSGFKAGVLPVHLKTWYALAAEYKTRISQGNVSKPEIIHELSIKHSISLQQAYKILKNMG